MTQTVYWVIVPSTDTAFSNVEADAIKIKNGQRQNGSAASWSGSEVDPETSGSAPVDESTPATGLTSGASYRIAATIWDGASYGGGSSPTIYVVESDAFTTHVDVTQAESATVTDSQSAVGTFAHSASDSASVSHSQSTSLTAGVAQAESATVSNSESASVTYAVLQAESATISEISSTDGGVLVSCTESATVSESNTSTGSFGHAADESLIIVEVFTATAVWASGATESATVSDDCALVGPAFDVSIAESVSVVDAVLGPWTFIEPRAWWTLRRQTSDIGNILRG